MNAINARAWNKLAVELEASTSPLSEAEERAALPGEGQKSPAPAGPAAIDTGLVAITIGLSLWLICAAMVISTFVAPGLLGR